MNLTLLSNIKKTTKTSVVWFSLGALNFSKIKNKTKNKEANLHHTKIMVDQNSKSTNWNNKKLGTETVVVRVVCCFEFDKDKITGANGGPNENDFHACVI